jgi:hypothetical protein
MWTGARRPDRHDNALRFADLRPRLAADTDQAGVVGTQPDVVAVGAVDLEVEALLEPRRRPRDRDMSTSGLGLRGLSPGRAPMRPEKAPVTLVTRAFVLYPPGTRTQNLRMKRPSPLVSSSAGTCSELRFCRWDRPSSAAEFVRSRGVWHLDRHLAGWPLPCRRASSTGTRVIVRAAPGGTSPSRVLRRPVMLGRVPSSASPSRPRGPRRRPETRP